MSCLEAGVMWMMIPRLPHHQGHPPQRLPRVQMMISLEDPGGHDPPRVVRTPAEGRAQLLDPYRGILDPGVAVVSEVVEEAEVQAKGLRTQVACEAGVEVGAGAKRVVEGLGEVKVGRAELVWAGLKKMQKRK